MRDGMRRAEVESRAGAVEFRPHYDRTELSVEEDVEVA
jgi:hypothetical protein